MRIPFLPNPLNYIQLSFYTKSVEKKLLTNLFQILVVISPSP